MKIRSEFSDVIGNMVNKIRIGKAKNRVTEVNEIESVIKETDKAESVAEERKKFLCPYCFEMINETGEKEIMFRATDVELQGSESIFVETADEGLIDFWTKVRHWGNSKVLREFSWGYAAVPVKEEDDNADTFGGTTSQNFKSCLLSKDNIVNVETKSGVPVAATDIRGKRTDKRVCPHCHCLLPKDYGTRATYIFAIVGIRKSGKTVYLSRFFEKSKELLDRVGIGVTTTESMKNFFETKPVKEGHELPGNTQQSILPPVFMTVDIGKEGKREDADFVFYDIAGEFCDTAGELTTMGEHIKIADGVIMLLAPDEQLESVKKVGEKEIKAEDRKATDEVLNAMYEAFKNSDAKLAIVISKSDMLCNESNKDSIIFRDIEYNTGAPGFMEDEAEVVNAQACDLVGNTLLKQVNKDYDSAKYFAVSTLGGPAQEDGNRAPASIKSTRLEEPIAWILSEFGIIDKVSNKKWIYNGEVVAVIDGENV